MDLTSFRLTRTFDLGSPPSLVVASPTDSAHRAFALTPANGTIHQIDQSLNTPVKRRLADTIGNIVLQQDNRSLLAIASHQRELLHVELENLAVLARHKLADAPDFIDFSSPYLATAAASGLIELIHLPSGRRTKTEIPGVGEIRFRSDGKVLLVANRQAPSLVALQVPTLQVVAELPLAMRPDYLCFNADQGQLFISGAGMDGVAVVFPFNILEVEQTLLAGRAPGPMASSAAPAFLFVGSERASSVCILNIATRKPVAFVDMGGRPSFITVTPDSEYALLLDKGSGDMGVIHVPAIRANRLKTGAALYTMISVGSQPVSLAVVRRA